MRILFVGILLSLATVSLFSASKNIIGADFVKKPGMFDVIDKHALNTPRAMEKDLKTLVAYLTKPAKNDLEKTRAIWRWITANIAYDTSSMNINIYADDTFKDRKGVCAGYAHLFKKMGEMAGLKVEFITGWSKGYDLIPGTYTLGTAHGWNAVRIDGLWYLLDATWGAGYVWDGAFHPRYTEFYFFTPPPQFVFTHLPDDPKWQILKEPVNMVQYNELPKVMPFFWENNMRPLTHFSLVSYVRLQDTVKLEIPQGIELYPVLHVNEKPARPQPAVEYQGKTASISMNFDQPGLYILDILGRKKGEKDWQYIMQYSFISGMDKEPVILHDLGKWNDVHLFYPKVKYIRADTDTLFWITVGNGEEMKIINEGKTYYVKSPQNTEFKDTLRLKPGKVEVWVRIRTEKDFRPLAVYIAR